MPVHQAAVAAVANHWSRPEPSREAAEYVLQRLGQQQQQGSTAPFQGVCYFDAAHRAWMVADSRGRCVPRHSSPIAERDTFVIFDDARCRGADLQLRRDAVGLLTLGPGMAKDKLMQAAGRLRMLGRGQGLCFVGTKDVSAKIRSVNGLEPAGHDGGSSGTKKQRLALATAAAAAAGLTSRHVLQWVMHNTVQATQRGLVEWAGQGLHFAATKGAPERMLQDELLELQVGHTHRGPWGHMAVTQGMHMSIRMRLDPGIWWPTCAH